jgi:hypothetical protein
MSAFKVSQSRETEKYGYESRGTRNQEWLCWRGPTEIYPTGRWVFKWLNIYFFNLMGPIPALCLCFIYVIIASDVWSGTTMQKQSSGRHLVRELHVIQYSTCLVATEHA